MLLESCLPRVPYSWLSKEQLVAPPVRGPPVFAVSQLIIEPTNKFGGIKFGDFVRNSPIHQIKVLAKISHYTVHMYLVHTNEW